MVGRDRAGRRRGGPRGLIFTADLRHGKIAFMGVKSLLVANRGEIAVRVIRAAAELGVRTATIFSEDDESSLHARKADQAFALRGQGARAYLDIDQMVAAARDTGCDAIHPGYGFLSESAEFARRCAEQGITFVGPRPETLELFGDKARARAMAESCLVPVLPGTSGATSFDAAREFFESLAGAPMMIKALAGGGGRGMRAVSRADELESAYERSRSEAEQAFGNGDLYVERLVREARHIEVQVVGDGSGAVIHLGERECSIQRRHQKLVEIAPAPGLDEALREELCEAAVRVAAQARYQNLGTFEFLVDAAQGDGGEASFSFIEANARLQVEHTVTEEVTGVDLVQVQLRLAGGSSLDELGIDLAAKPSGYAMQVRVNMERMGADGAARPSGGTLTAFEPPQSEGIRTDSFGYAGYTTNPRFDSLLAKLIVHEKSDGHEPSTGLARVIDRARDALGRFKIEGVATNVPFLQSVLAHAEFRAGRWSTRFIEDHIGDLATDDRPGGSAPTRPPADPATAGARVDAADPLAVLDYGRAVGRRPAGGSAVGSSASQSDFGIEGPQGTTPTAAPMQGTIVDIEVAEGEAVHEGRPLLIMESMKMEHVIAADRSGIVRLVTVTVGDSVYEGHPLVFIEEGDVEAPAADDDEQRDLNHIRADLAENIARHEIGLDAARPEAVGKRRRRGHRTARENVADLCDPDSFVEYGPLVLAAQRRRRSLDDLIKNAPADGMVAGFGRVNGDQFGHDRARCIVMSYDYMVMAGTQGFKNHYKKDRMFDLAEKWQLPVVFFAEGGGGRPGDTEWSSPAGLDVPAFYLWGKLSGLVPMVGITNGRCFAGNAVILGCCDVIIATEGSNIGMGGPAMIEGGGLGVFSPEEVGPMEVQVPNGVVDIPVADEAEAVQTAKKYLSYFQGLLKEWECADQRLLRDIVPENRLRVYDIRKVIETLADKDSVLEIRRQFGVGVVTAFARIEGRPIGIIANNPNHLGGAIDADAADKSTRFMQLCDAFDIPILTLCDTPGNMVGPEVEKTALVRHACRMYVTASSVTVPFFTIVLRKGYGLGAQAMAGGSFKAPFFVVAWPTGEFGGMGLEGAVKLGYRKQLAELEDPDDRKALYDKLVAEMYEKGKAISMATYFEFDDVIDPAQSRRWIMNALTSVPPPEPRKGKKRPCIDTW